MSRGATARLFAALELPEEARERLVAWARSVAGGLGPARGSRRALRVLEPGSLHLTLCFLGNRPVGEIDALAGALQDCVEPAGELALGAPVWLPPRRPRALAVEVGDRDGRLARLQRSVAGALAQAGGWQPERRRFRAHVTVARLREQPPAGARGALPATPRLGFVARELVLYRSHLAPAGARYEALAVCPLASPPPAPADRQPSSSPSSPSAASSHSTAEPSLESTGPKPASHSGSEPSSQA